MREKVLAGKQVLFISLITGGEVDLFEMEEDRILCPHFWKTCSECSPPDYILAKKDRKLGIQLL
jgi:hypothetical protein